MSNNGRRKVEDKDYTVCRMHCNNCGALLYGIKRADGAVLFECARCGAKTFSRRVKANKFKIEVTI